MSVCDAWRESLVEHVLGAPASEALAAHLEACEACGAALADWLARMEQIDAGIRRLAASEPSPHAASRTLAQIHSQSAERGERFGWKAVAALLASVAIAMGSVAFWQVRQERHRQSEQVFAAAVALGRWHSPTQVLLRSPMDAGLGSVPRLGHYFYELKLDMDNSKGRRKPS